MALGAKISGPSYSQANQAEIFEGLDKSKPKGDRARLTPKQKRARKRQCDIKHKVKKKLELQRVNADNSFLRIEFDRLTDEIRKLKSDIKRLHLETNKVIGLEGNGSDLQNLHQQIPITGVATDSPITRILMQLEADDVSNVSFSDFNSLDGDGELIQVGKYGFPLSLHPIVKRINDVYGDVSATSKVNLHAAETIYILFCASVKEMDELQLEQVTLERILKWGDVIKDALRINFKVEFAMEHLKKIALAYIGQIKSRELKSMNGSISKLKADLNSRRDVAKKKVQYKEYIDAAEEFNGKTLSPFS